MAKAKGTTLIGAVKALRSQKKRSRELLPGRLHHYLVEKISTASWYPEEDLLERGGSSSGTYALWSSMHDSGRLRMKFEQAQTIVFELAEYASPSEEMCTIMTSYISEGLRISGRAAELEKSACVLDGAPSCVWRAIWQEPGPGSNGGTLQRPPSSGEPNASRMPSGSRT